MKEHVIENKNILSNVLIGLGLLFIIASKFGLEWMKVSFTTELGISCLFVAVVMKIISYRRANDENYKNEVLTKEQDERLIIEKLKRDKIISSLLTYELMIMVAISVYRDFSFNLGGLILLWSLIVFWIGVKILEGIKTRR